MNKIFDKLLIIDGSFQLHRNLKQPNMWELTLDDGTHTGGIFGVLRTLAVTVKKFDYYPVVVFDAGLAKRRLDIHPNYKKNVEKLVERVSNKVALENLSAEELLENYKYKIANEQVFSEAVEAIRERVRGIKSGEIEIEEVRPEDDYGTVYHDSREALIPILKELGIPSIFIPGWEGDDLMAILTRMANKSIVMTDDRDLIQLIDHNVDIYRPIAEEYLTYDEFMKENNLDSTRELVIHKAIVGDGSDNIPSVTNGLERKFALGSKRATDVAKLIYQSNEDPSIYLPILEEKNKNYYKGFISRPDHYTRNLNLVDLSLVENDEDVVAKMTDTIKSSVGKCQLFKCLGLMQKYEITSVDVGSIIQKLVVLAPFVVNEEGLAWM